MVFLTVGLTPSNPIMPNAIKNQTERISLVFGLVSTKSLSDAGDSRFSGCCSHGGGDGRTTRSSKGGRDDGIALQACGVDQIGDSPGRRDFHLVVDVAGCEVEGAAEKYRGTPGRC
jgi:hypothetical protein